MSNEEKLIEPKNENSEQTAQVTPNRLIPIFDPPTALPIDCLEAGQRSYIKDRRWTGQRAAEIVKNKYGGYDQVTNEQLSQATKQAWEILLNNQNFFTEKNESLAPELLLPSNRAVDNLL